jgi:hypothetical protein
MLRLLESTDYVIYEKTRLPTLLKSKSIILRHVTGIANAVIESRIPKPKRRLPFVTLSALRPHCEMHILTELK